MLTISLHEHPRTLFPGTGLPAETGSGAGTGYAVNVALPAGTGDAGWLRAFHAIVPPLLREFRPQVLVSQHGCDGHRLDPLAHFRLSIDALRAAAAAVHRLAHETAGGRWVLFGGGGYAPAGDLLQMAAHRGCDPEDRLSQRSLLVAGPRGSSRLSRFACCALYRACAGADHGSMGYPTTVSSCRQSCARQRWEVPGRCRIAAGVCASPGITGQVRAAGGGRGL